MKPTESVNDEATNQDKISLLPEDLLLRILSYAPVRISMSTSLLSKRWSSVWKKMPSLVYDESCPYNNNGSLGFDQFCLTSLPLHRAHVLKSLNLRLKKDSDSIDTLLFHNIGSTLLEITIALSSYPCPYSPVTFPTNFDVFETLVVLKLQDRIVVDVSVDSPVCFPSLKKLHLCCVKFSGEESLCKLLSACPVLEELYFQRLCSQGSVSYTVSVSSLKRLVFTTEIAYYRDNDPSLEINTPSLEYLKIFDRTGCFSFVSDMPRLLEADISVNLSINEKIMKVLTSIKHLTIDFYPSTVLDLAERFISNRVVRLEIGASYNIRSKLLMNLLKDFPNLQALKIKRTYPRDKVDKMCLVSEPSHVPDCLRFHLETFQWIGYEGTLEEKGVADYILRNAACLKTARISIFGVDPRGGENDLMIVKELESIPIPSSSCQLVIRLNNFR
ncbi:unnamed protein product [Cochlearia groenlandica]